MERPGGAFNGTSIIHGANNERHKPERSSILFPSTAQKYGHPVTYWLALREERGEQKHMRLVEWLKSEYGMGHGHANAVVAHYIKHGTGTGA